MSAAQDVCVALMLACSAALAAWLVSVAAGNIRDAHRDRVDREPAGDPAGPAPET